MRNISIETAWRYHGLSAIIVENSVLRMIILPELGGKILRLDHKPSDTRLLWENPRLVPRLLPTGTGFDDHFFGGWDELFPNDEPSDIAGESYPDHGELWTQPWGFAVEEHSAEQVRLHMWCEGPVTNTRIDRHIIIERDSPVLHFSYGLKNRGAAPLDFLWKLHPALNVTPASRIDLPDCTMIRGDEQFSDLAGEERFEWPFCRSKTGDRIDMRFMFSTGCPFKEFLYGINLSEGWCALTDTETGVGFGLRFPKDVFTSVWLFVSGGGWRGYRTAVLEPCTAWPYNLETAVEQGTCAHLEPGGSLACEVEAVLYAGLKGVCEIGADGKVRGV